MNVELHIYEDIQLLHCSTVCSDSNAVTEIHLNVRRPIVTKKITIQTLHYEFCQTPLTAQVNPTAASASAKR